MGLFGAAHGWGGAKSLTLPLSIIYHIYPIQGRRSRLKTVAAERSEEKQSHVVALYKQLGVWGAL